MSCCLSRVESRVASRSGGNLNHRQARRFSLPCRQSCRSQPFIQGASRPFVLREFFLKMQPSDIKALLETRLEDCEFHIQGEGCNFQVIAIGERFDGLSAVKRQQLIYGALSSE